MSNDKSQFGAFSLRGLNSLVGQLQDNPSIMENDWREPFKNAFSLTEQQRNLFDSLPAEQHNKVQEYFSRAA